MRNLFFDEVFLPNAGTCDMDQTKKNRAVPRCHPTTTEQGELGGQSSWARSSLRDLGHRLGLHWATRRPSPPQILLRLLALLAGCMADCLAGPGHGWRILTPLLFFLLFFASNNAQDSLPVLTAAESICIYVEDDQPQGNSNTHDHRASHSQFQPQSQSHYPITLSKPFARDSSERPSH